MHSKPVNKSIQNIFVDICSDFHSIMEVINFIFCYHPPFNITASISIVLLHTHHMHARMRTHTPHIIHAYTLHTHIHYTPHTHAPHTHARARAHTQTHTDINTQTHTRSAHITRTPHTRAGARVCMVYFLPL